MVQRMEVTVRRPRVRMAPARKTKTRLNVGSVTAIENVISSGSATLGKRTIPDSFLVRPVRQHRIGRSLFLH
jgi:hypothetical protein